MKHAQVLVLSISSLLLAMSLGSGTVIAAERVVLGESFVSTD